MSVPPRDRLGRPKRPADPEVFWKHVRKNALGCWEWTAYRQPKTGYGLTVTGSRTDGTRRLVLAHRRAWELATGETLTPAQKVCHTCDNPACVRNDDAGTYEVQGKACPRRGHLFLADQAENIADMTAKGRRRAATGEAHGSAKLTLAQVREIRHRYATGGITQTELAREYGVLQPTISAAIRGHTWKRSH